MYRKINKTSLEYCTHIRSCKKQCCLLLHAKISIKEDKLNIDKCGDTIHSQILKYKNNRLEKVDTDNFFHL